MIDLDQISVPFSDGNLLSLNLALGFIMFGVALELTLDDFKNIVLHPTSALVGIFSQFFLLPALTFLLILVIRPQGSVALGMILVAACPGGNISNYISHLAKANTALSVSLTAVATLLALVMTPFNFAFWGGMYEPAAGIIQKINLNPLDMFRVVLLLLGLPLVLGMTVASKWPRVKDIILKPIKILSLIIFAALVIIILTKVLSELAQNLSFFLSYFKYVFLIVLAHNAMAFGGGYTLARLSRRPSRDVRSITIETGIQNSGLGLVIIFQIFSGLGGMAIITALWGIWHMLAGIPLAAIWSRVKLDNS